MSTSTLLIINGLPASGKTTLAKWLARKLGWPIIHKDDVKEILFDTLGWSDRAWSMKLGAATVEVLFHLVEMQLAAGVSFVVECNFKPELASPQMREILSKTNAHCVQVLCHAAGRVRLQRFIDRARHAGHIDSDVTMDMADAWAAQWLAPLDLGGPVVEVDTTDLELVDYEAVFRQVLEHLST
ncbi:MAG: ATP-binding protein [Anaerolineae bacterium]|nr:ATP-binding protein [Anaerolineae bacterium]